MVAHIDLAQMPSSAANSPRQSPDQDPGAATASENLPGVLVTAERASAREVLRDFIAMLRLAAPQKFEMATFVGLYFLTSFVQMLGLACFNAGFAVVGADAAGPAETASWANSIVSWLHIPADWGWLLFFSTFLIVSILAASIDHLGWIVRLRLLGNYEADQTVRGLNLIHQVDPRNRVNLSKREMVMALRGDCKSARVVLQMIMLSTVAFVQIVFPFLYIFSLDSGMSLLGLAILAGGIYPIILLGRKAGGMSLPRQELAMAAGSNVSAALANLEDFSPSDDRATAIKDAREAIKKQRALWRKQYEIRSLCEKVPQLFSLLGTYVIIIWGVAKVQAGALSWGELMTFTIAARLVFQPFTVIGKNWAKTSEHYPRARRHLSFMRLLGEAEIQNSKFRPFDERVNTVSISDVSFLQDSGDRSTAMNLRLTPGDILTIVDPELTSGNPLLRYLTGTQIVEADGVRFNGHSLNEMHHESITSTIHEPGRATRLTGTLAECVEVLQPEATPQAVDEFAKEFLNGEYAQWLPEGTETQIISELKREPGMMGRYSIVELYDLHQRHKNVVFIDFTRVRNPERQRATLAYLRRFRNEFITIWLDDRPRPELGPQTVAVFDEGQFQGSGTLDWFQSTFPNWDRQINRPAQKADDSLAAFADLETMETELILEEEG